MYLSDQENSQFIFDGINTVELVKEFGSPLYVISQSKIKSKCSQIKKEFLEKYSNTKAAYASKAFLTMAMCKIIENEGLGLDVVSGGELYTAINAKFPMEKIMFHGNNKSYEELELAVVNSVGRIVVDNFFELDMLESIAKEKNKVVKILFRITPGIGGKTHQYITTGQADSKFGISIEKDIVNCAVKQAMNSEHIELMGFHFHVGSQLFDHDSYLSSIQVVVSLMERLKNDLEFITKELNTGGGFGIRYTNEQNTPSVSYFMDPIMKEIEDSCRKCNLDRPTIIIEPGRWIVGEAGITLYTIGSIKEIPNIRTYISVDGGLPDNPRPALYQAKYDAIIANKANVKPDKLATIAGKCCESGDILIWDLKVPTVNPGDILAVLNTGAYNYSMASNYNRLPRPAVVLVNNGQADLMVRRETYQDLISKELVPELLNK